MRKLLFFIGILSLLLSVIGCATEKGSYKRLSADPDELKRATKYSDVIIEIKAKDNVRIFKRDKSRMTAVIVRCIKNEYPGRFKTVNVAEPNQDVLYATVLIKQYEKGDPSARYYSESSGEMRIEAELILSDFKTKETISTYEVTKTFIGTGMFGATATIREAEEGFAKTAADVIAGKLE